MVIPYTEKFSKEQVEALEADLKLSNVKSRSQSGRNLSYIEGWHAIAEANRIFGFGGWSSETTEIKCVSEKPRLIGAKGDFRGYEGWGVSYVAKCRILVGVPEIVREGCGTGHGIDRDLGQAHESAIKEAETDARKRALMTFGNQFGLALYDKTQENVVDDTKAPAKQEPTGIEADLIRASGKRAAEEGMDAFKKWGESLTTEQKVRYERFIRFELLPIAKQKAADKVAAQ